MTKLLIIIFLVLAILVACTRPIDELIIRKVNSKTEDGPVSSDVLQTSGDTKSPDKLTSPQTTKPERLVLIINKSSKKLHLSENCSYAKKILDENKLIVSYSEYDTYISDGYELCSYCQKHF